MDAIRAQHVSIRYMTGDFKDIRAEGIPDTENYREDV